MKRLLILLMLLILAPTLTHVLDNLFAWEPNTFNLRYTIRIPEN